MTPFEIDILLHYFCCAEEHPAVRKNMPLWDATLRKMFLDDTKLLRLRETCTNGDATYECTERGDAYCLALQLVPLPESSWTISWPDGTLALQARNPHV